MEHLAPLLQTLIWVGLVGVIVWRYHQSIDDILKSLHHRIESGSGLRAGPFELTQQVRPQAPEEQAARLQEEVEQSTEEAGQSEDAGTLPTEPNTLFVEHQRAEDLALREVQSEFGEPVNRQMKIGRDVGFDGFFVQDGTAHIVEVKYVQRRLSESILRSSVGRITSELEWYGWRNVRIVFVAVFGKDNVDVEDEQRRLTGLSADVDHRILIRCYHLSYLARRFGAD